MADIFFSYSRKDTALAEPLIAALEAEGWTVWWDRRISPGDEFDDLTAAELAAASVAVVIWTPRSVASRWVKGEARAAAERGALFPIRFENADLPLDVRSIQTIDFDAWGRDPSSAAFRALCESIAARLAAPAPAPRPRTADGAAHAVNICVLPFANMSGDAEQDYFSDGISEDIITDLSKVSALSVVSRNTAFSYKGRHVDLKEVARRLRVTHILEGSVRKSGNRVRITAQLIDAARDSHVWAERYDRDMADIFALQDEISEAIVAALKVRLLPEEKKSIETRGTSNAEAYKLFLMARQLTAAGNAGSARTKEAILRLCQRATELDPGYARAWALMANAQAGLQLDHVRRSDGGRSAAERALALDPTLAEAHAAIGRVLTLAGRTDDAWRAIETALRLDPESYEVNGAAARWYFTMRRTAEAIPHYEKAANLMEADYLSIGMLMCCYQVVGDAPRMREAARRTLASTEKIVAAEPDNGSAISYLCFSLILLGERERARSWMERALLLDPDNTSMRYNFACDLILIKDYDAALDMLAPLAEEVGRESMSWWKADPDLDAIRDLPRYKAMMAAAEERLRGEEEPPPAG